MIFRQATQSDLDYIKANPYQEAIKSYPDMPLAADSITALGDDGCIWAVGGVFVVWEGVGELWMMLSADFAEHVTNFDALCAIRDKIEELVENANLRRVQVTIRSDFPQAGKMVRFFGFKHEGVRKELFMGRVDGIMYGKIMEAKGT